MIITRKHRGYITVVLFFALCFCSLDTNFSPSDNYRVFAPIIWVPTGLLIAFGTIAADQRYYEKLMSFPVWRKICSICVVVGMTCFITRIIVLYGIGDVITKTVGKPFKESSFITNKTGTLRLCHYRIDVDGFYTVSGGVCLDSFTGTLLDDYKVIWDTSKRGDKVILTGKKSVLGSSINKIQLADFNR